MMKTALCSTLGIDIPIIQAPIGSASGPELTGAVSNAGGLGTLALSWTPAEHVTGRINAVRALSKKPFAVNLALAWPQEERLGICLGEQVPIVSTFWGDPSPYAHAIASSGAIHIHTVGSAEEARRAVDLGVDVIVAQGWEAGGHVWGQVTTMALVPRVVDAVNPVPVVAAGGISDGRGIIAALALGASGVWLGTRFLLAEEARAHPAYREKLAAADETSTVYSEVFDVGWPGAPHRTLRNSTIEQWDRAGRPKAPHRPGEGEVVARGRSGDVVRYSDMPPLADMEGDTEALATYAGQGVGLVREVKPAAVIMTELLLEAREVAARLSSESATN